jgi:hypothetical protein
MRVANQSNLLHPWIFLELYYFIKKNYYAKLKKKKKKNLVTLLWIHLSFYFYELKYKSIQCSNRGLDFISSDRWSRGPTPVTSRHVNLSSLIISRKVELCLQFVCLYKLIFLINEFYRIIKHFSKKYYLGLWCTKLNIIKWYYHC